MTQYNVTLEPAARRSLRKLQRSNPDVAKRISDVIDGLEQDPRPPTARALVGCPGCLRIRVNDYRIAYCVQDRQLLVQVIELGHRRDIYDRL